MIIDAGKLDRRISILAKSVNRDAAGQQTETWDVAADICAQRLDLVAIDVEREAGRDAVANARYLIRYRTGIDNHNRVRVGTTDFAIVGIDEPDRRATMVLTLEEAK